MRMKEERARAGGVLLLVLGVMSLVLSLVLLSAGMVRARVRLGRDSLAREAARDTLLLSISNATEVLLADTNGVDSLTEAWAQEEVFGFPERAGFWGELSDESGKVALAEASAELLSAVLAGAESRLSPAQLLAFAEGLVLWRTEWMAQHEDAAPPAFAFYERAGAANAALVEPLRRWGSVYAVGPINVNTAPAEVLQAVLVSSGAGEAVAREMVRRALAARAVGVVVPQVTRGGLSALFLGEGVLATAAESAVLTRAARLLGTQSAVFAGRVECRSPRVVVRFVYDREEKRFVRWDEP